MFSKVNFWFWLNISITSWNLSETNNHKWNRISEWKKNQNLTSSTGHYIITSTTTERWRKNKNFVSSAVHLFFQFYQMHSNLIISVWKWKSLILIRSIINCNCAKKKVRVQSRSFLSFYFCFFQMIKTRDIVNTL